MKTIWIANTMRYTARIALLTIGVLVFIFALLSGSEAYGGGLIGILKNSPNALPWVILLLLVWLSWKKELIGGIIISILGLAMIIFFNSRSFIDPTVLIMTSSIFLFGVFFILSWWIRRKNNIQID